MNNYKKLTWLTESWIKGLFAFLSLASFSLFASWSLNSFNPIHFTISFALPVLLLCIAGAILIVYVSNNPPHLQKTIIKRLGDIDKSEKRNKAIVSALPDMIFIIDRDGRYVDFNTRTDHPAIINPGELISKKVSEILPGPLAVEVMTHIEKVLVTPQMVNHSYQLEVEGKTRSYESRYVPHGDNTVMIIVRDTTEAKIEEQRIRESESKYRMLVEQAADSIFIANFQGNFLVANPAGCKLSQYTEEELLNMRFHDLALADELKVRPFKLGDIASGKAVSSERKMRRKDGTIIDVEIAARIIAPNRLLASVRDITERKKSENELIKSREHLRQLNTYIENIREAERLNVSREIHEELGQQLAVLKMDISRVGNKCVATDAALRNEIDRLLNATSTMIETVRKISAELRPSMLDDIGLMATLDWYCGDFTKRTGIKASFASDIADDNFSKELNVGLFRIFQDSLINVAKHSEAKKVDVLIKNEDEQLVLLIDDNGKGFDSSTDILQALGIRAMMERAQMLKGIYNVNSLPGKGTIVEICVPLN